MAFGPLFADLPVDSASYAYVDETKWNQLLGNFSAWQDNVSANGKNLSAVATLTMHSSLGYIASPLGIGAASPAVNLHLKTSGATVETRTESTTGTTTAIYSLKTPSHQWEMQLPAGGGDDQNLLIYDRTNTRVVMRGKQSNGLVEFPLGIVVSGSSNSIAVEGWTTPSLSASWVAFGSGFEPLKYRKDPFGRVEFEGTVKSGTTTDNTTLFTLPVGYRPSATKVFMVNTQSITSGATSVVAEVAVQSSGAVQIVNVGSNTFVHVYGYFWLD